MNISIVFFISFLCICEICLGESKNQTYPNAKDTYALKGCNNTPIVGLKELWQNYIVEYGQHSNNSTFLINFNKRGLYSKGSCPNRTEMTLKQFCRLDDKFGSGYLFNYTTKRMIEKPRARLYWEKNYQGSYRDFYLTKEKGICYETHGRIAIIKSVKTFGTCIRVFWGWGCGGRSLAIYPGSNNSEDILNTKEDKVLSIGLCLDDEFSYASFENVIKRTISKNPKFSQFSPDLVEFYSVSNYKLGTDYSKNLRYSAGWKDRVSFLRFEFDSTKKLDNVSETPMAQINEFYDSLEKEVGDEMTFAIPLSIGGPSNETFNIFPASPECVKKWNSITSNILLKYIKATIALHFIYERKNSTRPILFNYHIMYWGTSWYFSSFGRILNGNQLKINLDAQPHEIDKLKATVDSTRLPVQKLAEIFKTWTNDTQENYSNLSLFFNERRNNLPAEIDCKLFQLFEDIQESPNIEDGSPVPGNYIQDMIGQFHHKAAILYSGLNYTGNITKYFSLRSSTGLTEYCANLPEGSNVVSVKTLGKCIRLYESMSCKTSSLAVYPGSAYSHNALKVLGRVRSIGDCGRDEFLNATFSNVKKGLIRKNPKSPDYYRCWPWEISSLRRCGRQHW